jgi:hypothetical protein
VAPKRERRREAELLDQLALSWAVRLERLQVRSGASSAFKIDRDFTNMLSERNDLRIDISKKFGLEPCYRRAGSPTMMYLQTIMSLGAIVTAS